jgi:HK97 family phage portal protein
MALAVAVQVSYSPSVYFWYMPHALRRLFRSTQRNLSRTKSFSLVSGTSGFSGFEHSQDINNLNSYKQSLYLYIGVSMIAKRAAGIPLELYKIKNKRGDVTEVFDHPVLALFNNPNDIQTGREFMEVSITHYLLSGDCFWLLDRAGTTIKQIIPLRPDNVQILLSKDAKRIIGYEYRSGEVLTVAPENMVHIKNPDPTNPLRGVGVVRPAMSRILTEIEATKYQAQFFKNQGRPDLAIFADTEVSAEQADEARADWKRVFGNNNSGNVGFFGRNVKSVQELNKTPKEMDFIQSQHFLRDDIMAALRIPKAMVTSDDVNMANAKEAYRMYLTEAVVPVLEAFIDSANFRLIPQIDQTVFFDFTDPVPVDRAMVLEEHKAGVGKWITQNEARLETNRPAIDGHDTLGEVSFGASSVQDTTSTDLKAKAKQILRARPVLVQKLDAISEMLKLTQLAQPERQMTSIFATKSMKVEYAKAVNSKIDRKAEVLKEAVDKYHDALLKRVLATDLDVHSFMDVQGEKRAAREAFTPVVVKLYKEGGQDALDAIFRKSATDFFADEVMIAAIEGRVRFFADSITDTTFEVLKTKITAGIAAGDGVDAIGRSLREYFDDMSVGRAKTIARTETAFALSKATNDAYAQSSVITGKEWITAGDDNVRDDHEMNSGVIVPKGAAFPDGESYPGEHSVNCRCVLAPAL